eukprot:TRINITY_DN27496_c0_g2_i1.p1 TRINITY_DN27496_c0_g2~~TRINITY_DN27496_c0_g2_i1.p1  ORF type:complete len:186 (+),score=32.56 TRINITY_DN27496_c0_g2_i1:24-560(+)
MAPAAKNAQEDSERLLRKACADGRLGDVKSMLHQVSPASPNESGSTPLHEAAYGGHLEVCELLLAARAEANEQDKWGASALHHAASRGHQAVVQLLLAHKADVNAMNYQSRMPMDLADASGHRDIASSLAEEASARYEAFRKKRQRSCLTWSASSVGLALVAAAGLYLTGYLSEAEIS